VVQGGTRRYKVVHDSTRNCIWRYMEVHGSKRICKTVHTGMYWNILILKVQSGSSWICCCNSAWPKALYYRPVHLITVKHVSIKKSWDCHRLCRHAAPGEALVAPPERGGRCGFRRSRAQRRRSGVGVGLRVVPRHCCRRRQPRQRDRALVRMQPW
jgi:hypothetical protein